jgi:thioredoxin 1
MADGRFTPGDEHRHMGEWRELEPGESLDAVLADHETVILEFHADWCAPCAVLETFLEELLEELDALVVKVDVEAHDDVAAEYDVTSNPTMVVLEDGEPVERLEELPERPAFRERVAPWT